MFWEREKRDAVTPRQAWLAAMRTIRRLESQKGKGGTDRPICAPESSLRSPGLFGWHPGKLPGSGSLFRPSISCAWSHDGCCQQSADAWMRSSSKQARRRGDRQGLSLAGARSWRPSASAGDSGPGTVSLRPSNKLQNPSGVLS